MKQYLTIILAVTLVLTTSGCASIVNGSNQHVSLTSNPSKATVSIDGQTEVTTPATVNLARKRDHSLLFSKEGYEDKQVTVMHVLSAAVAGNIIAGGLIGWGVDAATGAQYKLVPETVHVELDPLPEGERVQAERHRDMTPRARLDELEKLRADGLITEDEYKAMRMVIIDEMSGNGAGGSEARADEQPAGADPAPGKDMS
jgi:uncharacterized protein YceK